MTDHERLRSLRRFIATDDPHFPGLRKLKIRGKDLQNPVPEIFYLTELEVLDMGPEREACLEYYLDECPPEVGKLINLRALMLDTNELYSVPDTLGRLVKLERLMLSNNHLSQLPLSVANLVNLTSLHISNNSMDEFPHQILSLNRLTFLDFSDNHMTSLPRDIGRLRELHTLMLFNNRVTELPESITHLAELRTLWIGYNRLSSLPRSFGALTRLDWDDSDRHLHSTVVDGNPLTDPPIEVCRKGIRAITEYFGGS